MHTQHRNCWPYLVLAVAVSLAGCTVGPDFKSLQPDVPARWHALSSDSEQPVVSQLSAEPTQIARWWRVFDDSVLTRLVHTALQANLDLKQAKQRIRQARARLAIVSGQSYPQLGAGASYTRQHMSAHGLKSRLGEVDLFQAGFDASWELDLFGGHRRQVEAAQARLAASIEQRRGVRVTLAAEVARNYIVLRGYQRRLALMQQTLGAQQTTLALIRDKYQAGLASQLAVQRASGSVAQTRARLPPLETGVRQSIHRLSVLLAKPPAALMDELSVPKALPDVPDEVPVGLPSTLVRRRPDIRRAERLLHAATADIGVAVSHLFPQFSISGQFGFQSTEFDQLATWGSRFFGIGPALTLPIFQGGRLRAQVRIEKAQRKQALLTYRQTVLNALREVEDAIVAYHNVQRRRQSLAAAVDANRQALELARARYRSGLSGYLAVLDAQQALLRSRDTLAQSVQAVRTRLVALYKALGGGWSLDAATRQQADGAA